MGILNQPATIAKESTFNTASTTNPRAFELRNDDDWGNDVVAVESGGRYAGKHTIRDDRTENVDKGGAGSFEVSLLTQGMEPLLADLLGSHAATAPTAITPATTPPTYTQVYMTDEDGPQDSWTVNYHRSRVDADAQDIYTFTGCVVSKGSISCSVDSPLTLRVEYLWSGYSSSPQVSSSPALTYPGGLSYIWKDVGGELGGTPIPTLMNFTLDIDHKMKEDRHYMRGSSVRGKPIRSDVPVYKGSFEMAGDALAYATMGNWLESRNSSLTIEANKGDTSVTITMPSIRFDGDPIVSSLNDLSKQTVPFTVLHDGTNPAVTITYVTVGDSYT